MKLVRFEHQGTAQLGVLEGEDKIVSLKAVTAERGEGASMSAFLATGTKGLEAAKRAVADTHADARLSLDAVKLLAPVGDPGKIMCIGQNYRDHCEEQNQPIPERAILFAKYSNTINDPGGVIRLPRVSDMIDYEAELAVVIGTAASEVSEADAMQYVAGYLCANDVTARDIQKADGQWVRGKSPDTFFPIGPYLVTADEIANPHNLDISLTLNGETRQKSNTSNLIFKIPFLISYLSQTMTLMPGDILSTGTPGGVGVYSNPPVLLKAGDSVSVTITGLGTLTNSVAAK
jgi:2-keto-4-pentenoate hydratase/2-oxohepta-3-ene-1,7-dioic acid hydratase in catechol pathway